MPIVPPQSVVNQITPSGNAPYAQEQNFGQMLGEGIAWNPNVDSAMVGVFINHAIRKIYDRKLWYGLMTKGQIVTPGFYSTGSVSCVLGSPTITGIGTSWTTALIGQSLRVGYTAPIYNIIDVNPLAQTLTLELPWGLSSISSSGYFVTQYYYSIPNIRFIYSAKNLQLFYRLWTSVPQSYLDNIDPSRLRLIYPCIMATMPPDANGNYQFELWPASMTQMAIPYLAYIQPPKLVDDNDNLPAFMRSDVIMMAVIADCLRYRTKDNPYYSESVALSIAAQKQKEFEMEVQHMDQMDENLYRSDVLSFEESWPRLDPSSGIPLGSGYDAMLPIGSGSGY
jgi:hypothetical protein